MRWSFEVYQIGHLKVKQKIPFNKRPLGLSTMRVATGMKVLNMNISWFKFLEVLGNIAWTLATRSFFHDHFLEMGNYKF